MRTTRIENYKEAEQVIDNALAAAMHATCCAVNHTMKTTPGEMVYGRDMFIDIPVIADLIAIRDLRQLLIDQNLRRHNRSCYNHHY